MSLLIEWPKLTDTVSRPCPRGHADGSSGAIVATGPRCDFVRSAFADAMPNRDLELPVRFWIPSQFRPQARPMMLRLFKQLLDDEQGVVITTELIMIERS